MAGCVARYIRQGKACVTVTCAHVIPKGTIWSADARHRSSHVSDAQLVEVIKRETELSTNHLTPEIKLHLITQKCRLWHEHGDTSPFQDPFWAFYWPGGQVLTRYILDNPKEFLDRRVLDVGSGCGATAIGCKMVGANLVTANDIEPVALAAIRLNATANELSLDVNADNWIGRSTPRWDIVVLGDMFYDLEFANTLFHWITRLLDEGKTVFIGDPGRAALKTAVDKLPMQKVYKTDLPVSTRQENNGLTQAWVWKCINS
ncbi:LOW QUALITY PROTEIN: electron transfer flavoprotein beta subunit lysine methyltransferase-like [Liolophura sinensis]|uniref:LOW QUALITY PROTEIN: electron transfer flavoprotein beta subunit lysine methyltransferase-like n=1 Tax=Liolophura sinensis TaxID=3198878 RepID=UPI003158E00D